MLRSATFLSLFALTASCHPPGVSSPPQLRDSAPSDSEPVVHDTDADTEWIPAVTADPVFAPPGGAFAETVDVTIHSSSDTGVVMACAAPPAGSCELEPISGPIALTGSAILHARVDIGEVQGQVRAKAFVSVSQDLLSFESPIPVMVYWTDRSAPSTNTEAVMGLNIFEPGDDPARLGDAPTDSGRCRVKVRGSSTAGLSKPPYDIELWQPGSDEDRPVELLGMPADGDWVLYAPYSFDEALIRNALGYTLSNRVGRYAPHTRMVELFVAGGTGPVTNANYSGVYSLTEEIERAGHRVDVTGIGPSDIEEPELTGGYVLKRDRNGDHEDGFWAGEAGGQFEFSYPLVWVDPEEAEIEPEQQLYMRDQLNRLASALLQPDFTDPVSGLHYSEIIDVDSWIDHHILNVVVKNPDAFRLSGYMHKDRGGLIHAGPLWDLDRSAGANDPRATDPVEWDASGWTLDTTAVFTFGWYGGLFEDPDFRTRYWARWTALLADELSSDSILALVDELADPLVEPAARNAATWGAAPFPGEVQALEVWLATRMAWIENCVQTLEDPRSCP